MPEQPATGPIILHHVQDLEEGLKLLANRVERVLQREQFRGELLNQIVDPARELQQALTTMLRSQEAIRSELASLRAIVELQVGGADLVRERAA